MAREGVFAFDLDSERAERWVGMVRERSGDATVDWHYIGGTAALFGADVATVARACEALLPELERLQKERARVDFPGEFDESERFSGFFDPDAIRFVSEEHQAVYMVNKSIEVSVTIRRLLERLDALAATCRDEAYVERAPLVRDVVENIRWYCDIVLDRTPATNRKVPPEVCEKFGHPVIRVGGPACHMCGGERP